ncbi:hypothetical protein [Priestia megaterium]|jgi:hypothetical protein|uniref:hypothetical protein n=1 Tax=Priestia megaterium TaxID=1404 RepID=UPI000AB20872|nr:hypothetical protein [Priestia megaterium]MCR8927674.1 hypothetical protein [Priestia megaterium]MDH3185616.1 hypothetical protein [Priestia megaterium]MED3809665.1 hypothetical protein [Priestia megaterium]MED4395474.1 hypothetical protein [Priestia megaterium]MED4736864.1 hypothetical protein [Priestia megaterium]
MASIMKEEGIPNTIPNGEIEELLTKYPGAPKIELKGTTYYPYHQFVDWLSSNEIYKV